MELLTYKTIRINKRNVMEHRFVMEQHIGRKLEVNEVVHHIDGDIFNNDLSNLQLMTKQDHCKLHRTNWTPNKDCHERLKKATDDYYKNKRPVLYPNCVAEFARRGITQKSFEGKIGSHKTVHRKFNEPGKMTVKDMQTIADELGMDNINYLFQMQPQPIL